MVFFWKARWHLASFAIWSILLLVLTRPYNRTAKAYWIFVPVFLVSATWALIGDQILARATTLAIFHQTCVGLVATITILCLAAHALGRIKGWMRLGCFLLTAAIACVAPLMEIDLSGETGVAAALYLSVCIVPLGPALVFARWRTGSCFHRIWFLLWLAVGLVAAAVVTELFVGIILVGSGAVNIGLYHFFDAAKGEMLAIVAFLFLLLLPFVIQMSLTPFWQCRLCALLAFVPPTDPSAGPGLPRALRRRSHTGSR